MHDFKIVSNRTFVLSLLALLVIPTHAQKQESVCQGVARINDDIIRRDFYDNHKEQFRLPATVTVSEVFLPFRDQSDAAVSQRAAKLLTELRAGADFLKAVAENTPVSRPSFETRGSLGTIRLAELKENLAVALAKLNPGEFTQPLRLDSGYQIIRLDARMPATPRSYEDPMTQAAASRSMTMERAAKAISHACARRPG